MGYGLWVMEPISGFRLPFPDFLLSQFLLFRRLPWPILRLLCFLWRLVGFRLEARGLDPSRHFAPFAVKNALVDRSIRSVFNEIVLYAGRLPYHPSKPRARGHSPAARRAIH